MKEVSSPLSFHFFYFLSYVFLFQFMFPIFFFFLIFDFFIFFFFCFFFFFFFFFFLFFLLVFYLVIVHCLWCLFLYVWCARIANCKICMVWIEVTTLSYSFICHILSLYHQHTSCILEWRVNFGHVNVDNYLQCLHLSTFLNYNIYIYTHLKAIKSYINFHLTNPCLTLSILS